MSKKPNKTHISLLEAAGQLFSIHDYDDVTMREIAKLAGRAPSSVSFHFGTKEAIYRAVFLQIFDLDHALDYKKLIEKEPNVLQTADGQAYAIQRIVRDYFSRTVFYKEPWKRQLIGIELFHNSVLSMTDGKNPFRIETDSRMELYYLLKPEASPPEAYFWANIPDTQGLFYLMLWPTIEKEYDENYVKELQQRVINTTSVMMINLLNLPVPEMLR